MKRILDICNSRLLLFQINIIVYVKIVLINKNQKHIFIGRKNLLSIIKVLFELSAEMQEVKDQSQFRINPPLITVQDIEKKLKCPHGNPAFILCHNSKCQQPKGIMCRTNGCTCDKLHPKCSFAKLQDILTNLHQHQRDIPQDIKKSYKVANQTIDTMIKQLSELKGRLQRQQKYCGLQKCELSFMKLVEEQDFEKICGKFMSEIVKTFQSKKEIFMKLKSKKEIFMKPNKRILQEFQETKAKFNSLCQCSQNSIVKLVPRPPKVKITPDKLSRGLKEEHWIIDNTNSNVCIANNDNPNWLCSSSLPFDGEFVFTIKVIKMTRNGISISIGVMEQEKKGEERRDTLNYSVFFSFFFFFFQDPYSQYIYRPNEEQTSNQGIKCSCSWPLPKCPFQIECHVNRQQNTIAWHYGGKQQAKSILPKAWKTNKKQLCAIVWFNSKGDSVEMM